MQHKLILPKSLFDSSKTYDDGDKVVIDRKEFEVKVINKSRDGDTYELVEVVRKPAEAVKIAY